MTAFGKISKLQANAKEFETFWDRYAAHTAKADIDKYGAGFGGDPRFTEFKVVTFFESHSGAYGNSSCYRFGRFDADLAQAYMVRAMNILREDLFAKCAELMRKDAAELVGKAREEIERMQEALNDVLSESETGPDGATITIEALIDGEAAA